MNRIHARQDHRWEVLHRMGDGVETCRICGVMRRFGKRPSPHHRSRKVTVWYCRPGKNNWSVIEPKVERHA